MVVKFWLFLKRLVSPPEWKSLSESDRRKIMSRNPHRRRKLGRAKANDTPVDRRNLDVGSWSLGDGGENVGAGITGILADERREAIQDAIRSGNRSKN
ncbi:MAG: hypothetical protein EBR26_04445 [Microbacteriaceae bacterium]|nr:hypothetical protein [Microbacteriaceae bacterium]